MNNLSMLNTFMLKRTNQFQKNTQYMIYMMTRA